MEPNFVCWSADDARRVLKPLALEGHETVFLATHSEIAGFEVHGTRAHQVADASERGLLAAFAARDQEHVACVIEGEPGAGKSHLIRWLKVRWPHANDVVLLIERADGSLEGTLRELQRKLPEQFRDLLASVQPRSSLTVQGRAAIMLSNIAAGMRKGVFEKSLGDEEWCDQFDVPAVLLAPTVQQNWSAPNRLLAIIAGERGEERYSQVAQFVGADIVRLAEMQHRVFPELRHSLKATRFVRILAKEVEYYRAQVDAGLSEEAIESEIGANMPETSRFLAALNRRLNFALQGLLGVSGAALQDAFRRLRQRLRGQSQRLVLLLEDVTSAQGVDQDLLQVVVTSSTTQPDLCDLISVIGITPAYYRDFIRPQGNIVQRLTHHVVLGRQGGEHQDVASLRDESSQLRFAARYLRVIRAGAAAAQAAVEGDREVANRCEPCAFRDQCHAAFGAHNGVGFYPLSARTITRMFSILRPADGGMTLQTPRGIIQGILAPTFEEAETIELGNYPGPAIETAWHPRESRRVLNGLIDRQIGDQPADYSDRLRRLVVWWGEPGPGAAEPGTWAGLSRAVLEVFGLPWLGGAVPPAEPPRPGAGTEPPPKPAGGPKTRSSERAPGEPPASAHTSPAQKKTRGPSTKERLNQLLEWGEKRSIDDADDFWKNRVRTLIVALPWEQEGCSRWLRDAIITPETILLAGSGQQRALHLVVPAEPWARGGLAAHLRLEKMGDELSPVEREFDLLQLARFSERLRSLAREHLVRRVPTLDDGREWPFVGTFVQVLLARAWLRGNISPDAPLVDQWESVLAEESEHPASAPGSRVDSWRSLSQSVVHARTTLQEDLRAMVLTAENWIEKREWGGTDPSDAYGAIAALVQTLRPSPVPTSARWPKTGKLAVLHSAVGYAAALESLPDVAVREAERVAERGNEVHKVLRNWSIPSHIERVGKAVDEFARHFPLIHANDVKSWSAAAAKLQNEGLTGPSSSSAVKELREFITTLQRAAPDLKGSPAHLLAFALRAPAQRLGVLFEQLRVGEKILAELARFLRPRVAQMGPTASLTEVKDFAAQLAAAAETLRKQVIE